MKANLPTNVTKEMYNEDLLALADVMKKHNKPLTEIHPKTLNKLATKNSKPFTPVEFANLYS